jgi:hypothetical protein
MDRGASMRTEALETLVATEHTLPVPRRSDVHPGGARIAGSGKVVRVLARTNMALEEGRGRDVTLSRTAGVLNGCEDDFGHVNVVAVEFSDCVAGSGVHRGHAVNTHPGGEKTFVAYEGVIKDVATSNGLSRRTFEGQWWYLAGTGKFTDIAGNGTYRGLVEPDGRPVYTFDGEWAVARAGLSATA